MITNPTPQRALRGHMPQRPTPRAATTGEHHAQLSGRLTPRDRWLARMLHEHKVLTSKQIVELCYPSKRAANHRLLDLFKWRVVDRFQPFVSKGTAPMHYVLDIAGAVALAYEDGLDPKKIGYRHEDAIGIAHSLRLAHTVGVNGFFTSLVALSQRPGTRRTADRLVVRTALHAPVRRHGPPRRLRPLARRRSRDRVLPRVRLRHRRLSASSAASSTTTRNSQPQRESALQCLCGCRPTAAKPAHAAHSPTTLAQLDHPALVPVATSASDVAGERNPAAARWLPISSSATRRPGRLRLTELAQLWPQTTPPAAPVSTAVPAREAPAVLAAPDPLPPPRPPATSGGDP